MITSISQYEFDAFGPARLPAVKMIATEKAWFANETKTLIGAILFDHSDKDWNYVILGRDEMGTFRWIDGNSSFKTEAIATQQLVAAMDQIDESGEIVFSQGG